MYCNYVLHDVQLLQQLKKWESLRTFHRIEKKLMFHLIFQTKHILGRLNKTLMYYERPTNIRTHFTQERNENKTNLIAYYCINFGTWNLTGATAGPGRRRLPP